MQSDFLKEKNIDFLWNYIISQDNVFKRHDVTVKNLIYIIFIHNLQGFYDSCRRNKDYVSLRDMNITYTILIIDYNEKEKSKFKDLKKGKVSWLDEPITITIETEKKGKVSGLDEPITITIETEKKTEDDIAQIKNNDIQKLTLFGKEKTTYNYKTYKIDDQSREILNRLKKFLQKEKQKQLEEEQEKQKQEKQKQLEEEQEKQKQEKQKQLEEKLDSLISKVDLILSLLNIPLSESSIS